MTETTEIAKKHKKKKGVIPKDQERIALSLMREYGYSTDYICPIYHGPCLAPISYPHLSCIFCHGKLAQLHKRCGKHG